MTKARGGYPALSDEVLELMGSGVDVYVATRNAHNVPESMLAMGLRAHADRSGVTVYLPEKLAGLTLQNLHENGEVAVTLCRPSDLVGMQLKGIASGTRPSNETDRQHQLEFRAAMVEQFAFVGVPRSATRRLHWWPSIAVDVTVRDVYLQTPGPRAGESVSRVG